MWLSSDLNDDRPAWSPDGKRVAFESEASNGQELDIRIFDTTLPASGTNPVNVTVSDNLHEGKPVWSPDGTLLYFSRGIATPFEDIVRQPSNQIGGAPTDIVVSAEAEYQPALSPDGTQLCYTRGAFGSANADVYVRSSAPGSATTAGTDLSDSAAGGYNCAWSPDGTRVAWVEGTFTNGALVDEPANDSVTNTVGNLPPLLVNNTASHFDGNPDYARVKENCQQKSAGIIGTDGDDTLAGFQYGDIMQGLAGDDTMSGKTGKDTMCGKGGGDELNGGADNDKLEGGGGDDTLNGKGGEDKCFGGGGKDKFKNCEDIEN